jgi:hypothetical protein
MVIKTENQKISSNSSSGSAHINDGHGECLPFCTYYPSSSTLNLDSAGNVNAVMNLFESFEKEI